MDLDLLCIILITELKYLIGDRICLTDYSKESENSIPIQLSIPLRYVLLLIRFLSNTKVREYESEIEKVQMS